MIHIGITQFGRFWRVGAQHRRQSRRSVQTLPGGGWEFVHVAPDLGKRLVSLVLRTPPASPFSEVLSYERKESTFALPVAAVTYYASLGVTVTSNLRAARLAIPL